MGEMGQGDPDWKFLMEFQVKDDGGQNLKVNQKWSGDGQIQDVFWALEPRGSYKVKP